MKCQIRIHTKPFPTARDFSDMLRYEYHKDFELIVNDPDGMTFEAIWEERSTRKQALAYMQELSEHIADRLRNSAYEPWILSIEWIDANPIDPQESIRELTTSLSELYRNEYVFIPALTMAAGYDSSYPIQITISEQNILFTDTGNRPRFITIDQAMEYGDRALLRNAAMEKRFGNAREQQEAGQATHTIALIKQAS